MSDFIFYLFSILFLVLSWSYQLDKTSLAIQSRACTYNFLEFKCKNACFCLMVINHHLAHYSLVVVLNIKQKERNVCVFFTLNGLVLKLLVLKSPIVIHLPENYSSLLGFICTVDLLYHHQPTLYTNQTHHLYFKHRLVQKMKNYIVNETFPRSEGFI